MCLCEPRAEDTKYCNVLVFFVVNLGGGFVKFLGLGFYLLGVFLA